MQENTFHEGVFHIYQAYNQTIKPLIADIEARYQKFPDSLFNEIRALHDHLARCYTPDYTDDQIKDEVKKAESHVLRITFDCYKYLDIWFYDYVKNFEKKCANKIDLTLINNGEFAPEFRKLQSSVIKTIREAKKTEGTNKQESFNLYQKAYNVYNEIEVLIDSNACQFSWAKFRKKVNWILTTLIWLPTVAVPSIVTIVIGYDEVVKIIKSLFC
jgi:hypothetical protein